MNKRRYIQHPVTKKIVPRYRYIMECHIGRPLLTTEHVHHINGDFSDDRIENLELITASKHSVLHSTGNTNMLGKALTPEHKAKISEGVKGTRRSDSARLKDSINKRGDKNPMYGKPLSPEHRAKISEGLKRSDRYARV